MNKQLWKILFSNARAAVKSKGYTPQRIYPYVGLSHVGIFRSKDYQAYLNECARYVLVFCGGVWLDSEDQGF
jgi:hypothetical protein